MKFKLFALTLLVLSAVMAGCSHRHSATSRNAWATVRPEIESYNQVTMNLDDEPISYTIDISTPDGKAKLRGLSLEEARELALVEALMVNRCATLFNPQYTHLMKGNNVLRVTVFGYPARYKKAE